MNFVAALLLSYLPEAEAFGGLVVLMQDRGLRRYYSERMELLQVTGARGAAAIEVPPGPGGGGAIRPVWAAAPQSSPVHAHGDVGLSHAAAAARRQRRRTRPWRATLARAPRRCRCPPAPDAPVAAGPPAAAAAVRAPRVLRCAAVALCRLLADDLLRGRLPARLLGAVGGSSPAGAGQREGGPAAMSASNLRFSVALSRRRPPPPKPWTWH
jgi:hypothetical protein